MSGTPTSLTPNGAPLSGDACSADAVALEKDCIHCGLPLGRGRRVDGEPFCCQGCRAVYHLIHKEGLERYYDLRRGSTVPSATLSPSPLAWLDSILEEAPTLPGSNIRRLRLDIQGVHCAACVWLLEKLFERHAGGRQIRVDPALGAVDFLWDTEAEAFGNYIAEVERFGYRFGPPRKQPRGQSRALLVRMGICVAAALNVMTFSLAYYLGLSTDDGQLYTLFGQLSFALASIALLAGGWPFIQSAAEGLRRRLVHLDLPIALGMLLAFASTLR